LAVDAIVTLPSTIRPLRLGADLGSFSGQPTIGFEGCGPLMVRALRISENALRVAEHFQHRLNVQRVSYLGCRPIPRTRSPNGASGRRWRHDGE